MEQTIYSVGDNVLFHRTNQVVWNGVVEEKVAGFLKISFIDQDEQQKGKKKFKKSIEKFFLWGNTKLPLSSTS